MIPTREPWASFVDQDVLAVQGGAAYLTDIERRLVPYFERAEPRQRALAYLRGLLSPVKRKNSWQLAEVSGDATPYGFQHLLRRALWDPDAVRDALRTYVIQHLGDPHGVLVIDETGSLKKGHHSVGVARQHSGTAGKVQNCQIGTFLGEDRRFATKAHLAQQMLQRALAGVVPATWVTGDSVYGNNRRLRLWLEAQPLAYDWRGRPLAAPVDHIWRRWLLVRRSVSNPKDVTAYVVFAPHETPLEEVVRVAGTRWTIESGFEAAKGKVGLDDYEVRSWTSWYRHITLAMWAYALLAVLRAGALAVEALKKSLPPPQRGSGLAAFKAGWGLGSR